jgi:hypothetical protein
MGDVKNWIHTKYDNAGFTTGNLDTHINLSKLTQFTNEPFESRIKLDDQFGEKPNGEIEKILEREDTQLKKWTAWMEASQPILLPNLFGYSNYVVYKPQYPGYYEYIAQRAAFYSIAGKLLLWLTLIHGFYCMYVYGWFDNALTNDNPTSLTNRVTDLKAQRRVMNTYLKGKGGLNLVIFGLVIVTICCVV